MRNFRAIQIRNDKKGKRKELPKGAPTPKTRAKRPRIHDEESVENADTLEDQGDDDPRVSSVDDNSHEDIMNLDPEEDVLKPTLSLGYQGFSISGHCLCVVVEPWPTIRTMTEPTRSTPALTHSPEDQGRPRNRDPLFLPEEPDSQVGGNGGEQYVNTAYLERVLNDANDSDQEDLGGMVEFSQVLRNVGDSRAGAMNDDDDANGSVLFGDADEYREL